MLKNVFSVTNLTLAINVYSPFGLIWKLLVAAKSVL